jgi:hypothetical protein
VEAEGFGGGLQIEHFPIISSLAILATMDETNWNARMVQQQAFAPEGHVRIAQRFIAGGR